MAITYAAGEKYCLKNDAQDQSRLNVVFETFNISADAAFNTLVIPTSLKQVLGIHVVKKVGAGTNAAYPIGTQSDLVPVAGVLTVKIKENTGAANADLDASSILKVTLIGLSY